MSDQLRTDITVSEVYVVMLKDGTVVGVFDRAAIARVIAKRFKDATFAWAPYHEGWHWWELDSAEAKVAKLSAELATVTTERDALAALRDEVLKLRSAVDQRDARIGELEAAIARRAAQAASAAHARAAKVTRKAQGPLQDQRSAAEPPEAVERDAGQAPRRRR